MVELALTPYRCNVHSLDALKTIVKIPSYLKVFKPKNDDLYTRLRATLESKVSPHYFAFMIVSREPVEQRNGCKPNC